MPTATEEEISAVRLSNETFYRALTSLDIQSMDSVWLHEEGARCIHPGWEVIEGWEVIRQSWDIIFSNTTSLKVEASQVTVRLEGEMAWVSCLESITSGRDSDGITLARATNLFIKTAGGWKMILHHASQIPSGSDSDDSEDDAEAIIH